MDAGDIRLVIFDCDGVLVDSEPLASRVLAEVVSVLGYPLTAEQAIERFTGVSMATVRARIEADWGRALPDDFEQVVRERDFAAFSGKLKAIPGAREMLGRLRLAKCVASSGAVAKMRYTLALTGLLAAFEPHLFSASMVARGKPAPDLFLYAAERMGVRPERCAVVEDAVAGIQAARAAGMLPLAFTGGGHIRPGDGPALRAAGAARVFRRMEALPRLLRDARP